MQVSLFKDRSGRSPGSGLHSYACQAPLGLACPSLAGTQWAFSSGSELPSRWVETLLTSLYPCVLLPTLSLRLNSSSPSPRLPLFFPCRCEQPEGKCLLRAFAFYTNEYLLVRRIQKDLHSPTSLSASSLTNLSLHLPRSCSFYFFVLLCFVLITSRCYLMPLSCTVDEYFPACATAIWSVYSRLHGFSTAVLQSHPLITSTDPFLPNPYLINKLPVYYKRNKHSDLKIFRPREVESLLLALQI